ncbi:WD40 repeat-like protein [Obba rivulosa]|uniref:WD40 repeat-like protein n=1 Tax=Obba rivulosa TaxID=1052685 RepID=A0A8E2AX75_9APHY|nr:WD40 repeat-like protein [Obba rivulosa]
MVHKTTAIMPPPAQASARGPPQANVGIAVKAIAVELNSRVRNRIKSVLSHKECTISFIIGTDTETKSLDGKYGRTFRWDLDVSRDIPFGTPLTIYWKIEESSGPSLEIALDYEDIINEVNNEASGALEHKYVYKHQYAKVTVTFALNKPILQPEDMGNILEIAGRRKSILDRLGKSKNILRSVIDLGVALGELNSVASAVFSCLDVVYKKLEEQDEENGDVLDLVADMSDVIGFTFDVEQFTTIAQLKSVIVEMRGLMQEVGDLVVKRDNRSNSKELSSALLSGDRDKIDNLKGRLSRFKQKFDRGIDIQTIITVETIKAQLKKLASATEDARYLEELNPRYNRADPPRCLQGTRETILSEIAEWSNDFDASNVLWIHAYPGAGKSTIAFTIARQLEEDRRLGAVFAFDRKSGTSRSILWRYISYKLAQEYPVCRDDIVSKLKVGSLHNKTATEIFRQLVAEPLRQWARSTANISHHRLPVIVIDALDECGGLGGSSRQEREDILSHIDEWAKLHPHFKLIVTSRFEHDISHSFSTIPHLSLGIDTGDAVKPESTRDIQRYIEHRFKKMAKGHESELVNWPGEDVVHDLSQRASGIFIWAATLLNYIEENPDEGRLYEVQHSLVLPPGNVYALYRQILENAFSGWKHEECRNVVTLVGTIVAAQLSLTSDDVASLLHMRAATARMICKRLRPVLDGGDMLRFTHQSFVDFLLAHTNDSDNGPVEHEFSCPETFHIDLLAAHHHLTESMFCLMNQRLRFNMCNIESSFMYNKALPQSQVDNAINRSLSYACQFWGFHLDHSPREINLVSPDIRTFMKEKLLFWFEALSLLGALNTAVQALVRFQQRFRPTTSKMDRTMENVVMLARDAIKFVQYFAPAMAQSAPHIYMSALPFSPRSSVVANVYGPQFRNTITIAYEKLADWPAEQMVIRGHDEPVLAVAFAPDGQRIASGSHDNTVRIWDAHTGQTVTAPFEGHTGSVWSVAFSSDSRHVVSGSGDHTIRIWDVQTGQAAMDPLQGHKDSVYFIAFSPNGRYIVSGSGDKTIRIWDAQTGQAVMGPFEGHEDAVWTVAFSPDGRHVVSGSADRTIRIWNAQTGQAVMKPFEGHKSHIFSVAFSPDGQRIASGSGDNTIRIWDVQTGQTVVGPLERHKLWVNAVAFSPSGQHIVSCSDDETIWISDAQTGQAVIGPFTGHKNHVFFVAFSPDGQRIVSGSGDETIRIWDAQTSQTVIGPLEGHHEGPVNSVAVSPDGQLVVSGSGDKTIRIWDAQTGQEVIGPFEGHESWVNSVVFSPDGQRIASGSRNKTIEIWDVRTGQMVTGPFKGHELWVNSVAFSSDGRHVVSGSADKTIWIWNVQTGRAVMGPLEGHEGPVNSVMFSPDGQHIVSGSGDKTIRIWDAQTGRAVIGPLEGHKDSVNSVAFSPNGQQIASGSDDTTIRIWDAQTGQTVVGPFKGHKGAVNSIAFSSNGQHIVSGSSDKTVWIWDALTGKTVIGPFKGHEDSVKSVAFSPYGVVSSSDDKTIRIWHVEDHNLESFTDQSDLCKDGWVLNASEERLFWVPHLHRLSLYRPSNVAVIGPYKTRLDLSRAAFGRDWTRCHTPSLAK